MSTLIYANPLASPADVDGFQLDGDAHIEFPNGRMQLSNVCDPGEGQVSNFVYWCTETFPADIRITWEFQQTCVPRLQSAEEPWFPCGGLGG